MLAVIVVCMRVVITVDCDGDIEEHFRRSLGRDYCNYLSHSSGDCTVRQSSAQWNGAVACSSAAAAPCSSAVTSSGGAVSRTTLSDLLSTDAEICDSTCDASKKCSAISITGVCVCARAGARVRACVCVCVSVRVCHWYSSASRSAFKVHIVHLINVCIIIDGQANAWLFSVFTQKQVFWPSNCQISTDLDKI